MVLIKMRINSLASRCLPDVFGFMVCPRFPDSGPPEMSASTCIDHSSLQKQIHPNPLLQLPYQRLSASISHVPGEFID